jgi:hypothetical protein
MTNNVIDKKFAAIIEAVSYWLGYQLKIGRHQLIHEASLRYPIADTITSQGIKIDRIVLEKLHPVFKSKKIDLVIYEESVTELESEKNDAKLKEVYEFKIAKRDTSKLEGVEHQSIFDDIVRLAYYHKWGQKDCYFLMCGKYEEFKTYFIGQKNNIQILKGKTIVTPKRLRSGPLDTKEWIPGGLYMDWFGFKIGEEKEKEFKVKDPSNKSEWGLQSFKNNYQIRDEIAMCFSDSLIIKTTCLAITQPGLEVSRTHAAGVWKIESR